MTKVLLEDCHGDFIIDKQKIHETTLSNGVAATALSGRLSVCGTVNGNNRRYGRPVWEKNLAEDSHLSTLIKRNAAFGTLEHPSDGKVDLSSPISHLLTNVYFCEDNPNEIYGTIVIANTPEGNKLRALIEMGFAPTVSSRGFGSLVRASDGVDEVQDDFICEGWDIVIKPSFQTAVVVPVNDTKAPSKPKVESISQDQPSQVVTETKTSGAPAIKKSQNTMEIKSIRESVQIIEGVNPSTLTPQRFAEGFVQFDKIHSDIEAYRVENPASAWECNKLHDAVSKVQEAWEKAAAKPTQDATQLKESNEKVLKVLKAVANTGIAYRDKIAECLKKISEGEEFRKELVTRGRGWKSRCEAAEAELITLKKRYQITCEATQIVAQNYKEDVTALGRAVLSNDFAAVLSENEALKKELTEATLPRQIVALRGKLAAAVKESCKKSDKKCAKADDKKEDKKDEKADDKKGVKESQAPDTKDAAPATPVTEAKEDKKDENSVTEGYTIVDDKRDPNDINESIAMAVRLSSNK